ncbi:MAG: cytochrome C [Alphaproteobacteria bacterium]
MKIALAALAIVVLATISLGALITMPAGLDPIQIEATAPNVKRGAYLARVAGCVACHTDASGGGAPFAGGVALESKFGTFYSPNITQDTQSGIGDWSLEDFARALRHGISPAGTPYYPAFPYAFYASLNDRDVSDLWAALRTVPANATPSRDHDVGFPFSLRSGLRVWRAVFDAPPVVETDPSRSAAWNRGRFIADGLAHCGACHTPRNLAGAPMLERAYTGDPAMLDGGSSPPIDAATLRANGWTREALITALRTGIAPDGDVLGGSMKEVVSDGTSYLLPLHLEDLATFLLDED